MNQKKSLLFFFFICLVLVEARQGHLRREDGQLNHDRSSNNGIGGALAGFIIGPILFIWSFIFIWNNERKAAIDYRRMKLAESLVKEVNPFKPQQISQVNGQLVHITGSSQCNQTVTEPESGISMNGVVKIKRDVQVRQWRERGSNQNRHYELMWASSNDSTPGGGHSNDEGNWFIKSGVTKAQTVSIGNYLLSESLKDKLICDKEFTPNVQNAYNIGNKFSYKVKCEPFIQAPYMYFPTQPGSTDAHGTLRIKYSYCGTGETSIISQSVGNSFKPFEIDIHENGVKDSYGENSNCCCCVLSDCTAQLMAPLRQIDLITQKTQSYQQMIEQELKSISCKKHAFRALAYFIMVLSICAFFSPITNIIGYVPFVGGFLSSVIGLAIFIAALVVALPLFLLAVAISWLVVHPKVGIVLLLIALAVSGAVIAVIIKNKGNQPAQETVGHLFSTLRPIFSH